MDELTSQQSPWSILQAPRTRTTTRPKWRWMVRLCAVMLAALVGGRAEFAWGGSFDRAAKEALFATLSPPTTPVNVLRNVKVALEHGLVASPEFLDDEYLTRVFGPLRQRLQVEGNEIRRGFIWTTTQLSAAVGHRKATDDQERILVPETGEGRGRLIMKVLPDGVVTQMSMNDVIEALGPPLEVTIRFAPSEYGWKPVTHEHGNRVMIYEYERPGYRDDLTCSTGGDGRVEECNFHQWAIR